MNHRIILLGIGILTGCEGDYTSSNGELGNLTYGLYTDYEGEQEELTDLSLMTRYDHWLSVDMTPRGQDKADDRDERDLSHSSSEAEVQSEGRSFSIQRGAPGEATIESTLDGKLFDRITLQFDDPTHLDLISWIRQPWQEEWVSEPGTDTLTVPEGTQISFLVIPMADDERLGGDFIPEIVVDAPELVVPDTQVGWVQEGGVTRLGEPVTYYAIEPGTVTFTLSDPGHGIEVRRTFEITGD